MNNLNSENMCNCCNSANSCGGTNGISWDREKCEYCGPCAIKCPNDAIMVVNPKGLELPSRAKTERANEFKMCDLCGTCVSACPTEALQMGKIVHNEKEYDRIEFTPSLCDSCGACVEICPQNVLKLNEEYKLKGFCVMCLKCIDACDKTKKNALSLK
ncbi:ferredoxin [Methanococcus voltae PS]|uniref:Ferredoxin n=1 Tax=Methanococcus voltae PS TaxID=523842 RepID=A0ABT2EYS7_METVO|nr:ferredoxin [Methanococcus voltae PS]